MWNGVCAPMVKEPAIAELLHMPPVLLIYATQSAVYPLPPRRGLVQCCCIRVSPVKASIFPRQGPHFRWRVVLNALQREYNMYVSLLDSVQFYSFNLMDVFGLISMHV